MACPDRLSQWTTEVSTAFAHLSLPATVGIGASFRLSTARTGTNVFQRLCEW